MATYDMPGGAGPSRDERHWAMLAHLSAMLMYVTVVGGFVAPLVIWLMKRDDMPFVRDQGLETLNFQITILLALTAGGILMWVAIGFVLVPMTLLFHFVVTIIASVRAADAHPAG